MERINGGKARELRLLNFRSVPMRTFHITWLTFFVCFFGWFGIAPLMPVVREDLDLTHAQIGNIIIGSVAITVFARLFFGWLCDRIGPRLSYTLLLLTGSLPVMGIGLSESYEAFLLFRLAIGITGASFVITQYHTTSMFASNIVGTANATAAGWGNMGGGVTLMVMPFIFAGFIGLGYLPEKAWRLSMLIPGGAMLIMACIYFFCTRDTPDGNTQRQRKTDQLSSRRHLREVCYDYRVWMLFLAYGACFGIEITIDNIATLYFIDTFDLGLQEAGLIAGSFGMMNLFARALGGIFGDAAGRKYGLRGRILMLSAFLVMEGLGVLLFANMHTLSWAIGALLLFALFLKMANGATYAIVPFVHARSVGMVSGIVGAGGNVGAVVAGLLFATDSISYRESFIMIGTAVLVIASLSFLMTLSGRTRQANRETPSAEIKPVLRESVT
ncbi:MAG TPA: MFS transporter [Chryseosolibacter sp.]|nr:MFS transporter [Chryseosolibacter sp.]